MKYPTELLTPANTLQAVDRNVIYGYHGEFFRGQGQAGQTMHYYDDGLFVGQFGEASPGHSAYEGALPGFAGNGHCPNLVKTTNGDYYLWVNDESDHGPQRWHFANARNIREQTGSGALGSAIIIDQPVMVSRLELPARAAINRRSYPGCPCAGAASYNIRYSMMNGGPYNMIAGNTTQSGLCRRRLEPTVKPIILPSRRCRRARRGFRPSKCPFIHLTLRQSVFCAGSMSEGGQFTPVIDINSGAPGSGQPSYAGAEHYTGVLNLRELDYYGYGNLENETVGTDGYIIFDWEGVGTRLTNISSRFTVTQGSGWSRFPTWNGNTEWVMCWGKPMTGGRQTRLPRLALA